MLILDNGIMDNSSFFLFVVKTISTLTSYSYYYSQASLHIPIISIL